MDELNPIPALPEQEAPLPDLPWIPFEDPALPGFWTRVGAMFQLLVSDPLAFFDRAPRGEGLGAPWRFMLLLSVPALLVVALVVGLLGLAAVVVAAAERRAEGPVLAMVPLILMGVLALMPVILLLGMLIGGAIQHACLWMWGGTRQGVGLHQTIRAVAYANAFLQLGAWIPYLGLLVQLLGMVWIGMGLARLHRTDTWRGVCAAFTPLLLLCVCLGAALALVPLALLAAGRS